MAAASFSAGDALRYLAEREEEGVRFYEGLKEGTESEFIRELAGKLARAEERHRQRLWWPSWRNTCRGANERTLLGC